MRITLKPEGIQESDGWAEIQWDLLIDDHPPKRLCHAVPESLAHWLPDQSQADHVVCASMLHAMRLAYREQSEPVELYAEGSVSPQLLAGLETLQAIWRRWRPQRYAPVRLTAAKEQAARAMTDQQDAIFAFSGGVDASFSLFRHFNGYGGRNHHVPDAAMVVHGMDIPLDQPDRFKSVLKRTKRLLDPCGITLVPVKSNTRILQQPWEDSYGLQLTACFLLFQTRFKHSLHGSGEPYEALVLPWGTTPLSDHLPSTEIMQHHIDGAAWSRTEKVAWLAQQDEYTADLRVCWQGAELDRNCGRCEKCIRTMLNFWASGNPIPVAFPEPLTADAVRSIKIDSLTKLREIQSLYCHAQGYHPQNHAILKALKHKLSVAQFRELISQGREFASFLLRGK